MDFEFIGIRVVDQETKGLLRAVEAIRVWGEHMKREMVLAEVRDWVDYDRAGAPYGYMRKDMERWRRERHAKG